MTKRKASLFERVGLRLARDYIREATGYTIDADEGLFTRISARSYLSPLDLDRAQEVALHLYQRNPMAKRMTDLMVDFVVGADGLTFSASEDVVQQVIEDFWFDPAMSLDFHHRELVRDLSLYGEIAFRRFVNETSHRTRLGVIDIRRVIDVRPNPLNVLEDKEILLAQTAGDPEVVPLIVYDDASDEESKLEPTWKGDGFYFAVNRLTGQHRGVPDLFAMADWIDGYDQLLFNSLERSALTNAWVWDVTLDGAEPEFIDAWVQKHGAAPPPGSVRAHNEREKWAAVAPNMSNADTIALGRAIKNMSLGGFGVPEAWFAEGDSANRATLAAQGDPTYRMLQSRQKAIVAMFERMVTVTVHEQVGTSIPVGMDTSFKVIVPDLSAKDTAGIAQAMPQVMTALVAGIEEELISRKSARSVFLALTAQTGVDLDAQAEEDQIAEEAASEQAKADEETKRSLDLARKMGMTQVSQSGEPVAPAPVAPVAAQPAPKQSPEEEA